MARRLLPDESLPMDNAWTRTVAHDKRVRGERLGGTHGNEILTSATAATLTLLLALEGITIVRLGGLLTEHMFIGMVLIPPLLLKLGSTGYRFLRYYAGTHAYREKGPPLLGLRLLAPILVATTIVVFATGVGLLVLGHPSNTLLTLHKASFILWGACFAIHFLAYLPRTWRSLRSDWRGPRRPRIPGAGLRRVLVVASLGAGLALAIALLSLITGWQTGLH